MVSTKTPWGGGDKIKVRDRIHRVGGVGKERNSETSGKEFVFRWFLSVNGQKQKKDSQVQVRGGDGIAVWFRNWGGN